MNATQRSEWLNMRRDKIGASDAAAVMGLSPWKTPYELWREKLGLETKEPSPWAVGRGIKGEKPGLKLFEEETGLIMMTDQVRQHEEHEWMIATLDGIDVTGKNLVEIKCPGKEDHQCALDGQVPEKYMPQLQHQMEVVGVDKAYYYSFDGKKGKILEVYKDEKYVSRLLKEEIEFWDCVQRFTPPKLTDRDFVLKEDAAWKCTAESWMSCQRELKLLEAREEELRTALIELSGKSSAKGCGIRVARIVRKGNVQYTDIPELEKVNLELYRKGPSETWRITAE